MFWQVTCVLILGISLVVLFWVITRNASARIVAQFRSMAERFDVDLTEPPAQLGGFIRPEPFLHGVYRGCEFSISVPGKGLQNTRQIETLLKVQIPDAKTDLQMAPASTMSRLARREKGKKRVWKSGDSDFDTALTVYSSTPESLELILDVDARESFLKLLKGSKATIYMGKGVLTFAEFGLIANDSKREVFERAVETFCDFADSLADK